MIHLQTVQFVHRQT